ncbi:MAG: hypothetical protein IH958_00975 [Chloroflexi bacterium]|nr:hypothetical protein [Chloroflexota bacterium]
MVAGTAVNEEAVAVAETAEAVAEAAVVVGTAAAEAVAGATAEAVVAEATAEAVAVAEGARRRISPARSGSNPSETGLHALTLLRASCSSGSANEWRSGW